MSRYYVTEFKFSPFMDEIFNKASEKELENFMDLLSKFLKKYDFTIITKNDKLYLAGRSIPVVNIDGYFTTLITTEDSKKVILLTLDSLKVLWINFNKYIKFYDVKTLKLSNKCFYFIVVEKLKPFSKEKSEEVGKIVDLLHSIYNDYGWMRKDEAFNIIKEYIGKVDTAEIKEQIELLMNFITNQPYDMVVIDGHDGNIMENSDGKLVLIDPIVVNNIYRDKRDNCINLDLFGIKT